MNIINPKIFKTNRVGAGFTLSNRDVVNVDGEIAGLNLGYNTGVDHQEIENNLNLLVSELGIARETLAMAKQVHGKNITFVTKGGIYPDTDALITDQPEVTLGIRVADCAAILLADTENSIIAAVHAGWRGAALGILLDVVRKMKSKGVNASTLSAYISPCLSKDVFEVGDEVAEQFPSEFVDYNSYSKPHLNLKGFLYHQLLENGVPKINIKIDEGCTLSDNRFYSYRRERDKAGRMLGFIRLKS
ncbi:MAG: peptidoglycan editing factor PgeF [Balneolaceae bacterium]